MRAKLKQSIRLVERALTEQNISRENKGVLAFSGGINSTCVMNLPPILGAVKGGSIDLLFNNTLVEFPQTIKFVDYVRNEIGANVIVAKPDMTFKEAVKRYGFPISPGSRAASMCCGNLKKKPTHKLIKEYAWPLYMTGLRADENQNRRLMAKRYGDYFDSKTYGHRRCHPILHWTLKDVWEFQQRCGFKYNSIYDMLTYLNDGRPDFSYDNAKIYQVRTGCWCCPQGLRVGKLKWLREHFPKMFRALVVNMGLGEAVLDIRIKKNGNVKSKQAQLMRDVNYKDTFGVEKALEMHPCYFDDL